MKHITTSLLAVIVSISIFGVVVVTSCNSTNCNNVICQNGGSCANGVCTCPTGFSGISCETAATTAIVYINNTYTPISIAVNGKEGNIPVGGSLAFTGKVSSLAKGTATTTASASSLGTNISGGLLGNLMNWDINNTFPATDTLKVPLDVGSTYFFLRVTNKSSSDIIDYYVNYQFPYGEYYGDVTIPKDGKTYDLGYYLAYSKSNFHSLSSDNKTFDADVNPAFTKNQLFSVTVQ
jgi:hypothetical protein